MGDNSKTGNNSPGEPRLDAVIKLAILAVGGQGGGVLSNWIVNLAERNGYQVQSTSVAGVAQRTGATIYYIEMLPVSSRKAGEQQPVFSLAPSPGDVDILVAAEMMEAGRAILRGFVTPDRTVLITSTHRAFATAEKIAPGDAIADTNVVMETARKSCKNLIAFDMESIANTAGTVISASLFGALAGSGALPFAQTTYEDTITASGRGVGPSLEAFRVSVTAARDETSSVETAPLATPPDLVPHGPATLLRKWQELNSRIQAMPHDVQTMTGLGLRKVVDFQDVAYGSEYLDRVGQVLSHEPKDTEGFILTITAAKYIANAMVYDDIIRVADIKTRKSRFDEISNQFGHDETNALRITEYFHPGGKEICSLMPVAIGQFIEARPGLFRKVDWLVNRGRRVRTDTVFWFITLYLVSGLRRFRRKLLRHKVEQQHMVLWIEAATSKIDTNYDLAVEIFKCRRLIKGYSDTHQRGLSKFDKVLAGIKLVEERDDAADWARRLRQAALDDVEGQKLDGALETIRSFTSSKTCSS